MQPVALSCILYETQAWLTCPSPKKVCLLIGVYAVAEGDLAEMHVRTSWVYASCACWPVAWFADAFYGVPMVDSFAQDVCTEYLSSVVIMRIAQQPQLLVKQANSYSRYVNRYLTAGMRGGHGKISGDAQIY